MALIQYDSACEVASNTVPDWRTTGAAARGVVPRSCSSYQRVAVRVAEALATPEALTPMPWLVHSRP